MAMRRSTRRELNKLREIVSALLIGKKCCFCRRPLISLDTFDAGEARGPKLLDRLTLHHRDHDHSNNDPHNWKLAHQTCHKSYHARKRERDENGRLV